MILQVTPSKLLATSSRIIWALSPIYLIIWLTWTPRIIKKKKKPISYLS
ncbi:hypothetical protein NC651_009488 [Populus alba x Populus x berolinensis]|nr:hypothetical protein NC651_009488 [Populus alba x Populus x berolinensis]